MRDSDFDVLACPNCVGSLSPGKDGSWAVCDSDGFRFAISDGIPRLILPERRDDVSRSASNFAEFWSREGWGSDDDRYLQNLPYRDTTGRQSSKWRVKARSLEALRSALRASEPKRVLDLGAGMGWLSHHVRFDFCHWSCWSAERGRSAGLLKPSGTSCLSVRMDFSCRGRRVHYKSTKVRDPTQ